MCKELYPRDFGVFHCIAMPQVCQRDFPMFPDGIQFFKSANGVILTPGDKDGYLKPKYFKKIVDVKTGRHLFVYACSKSVPYLFKIPTMTCSVLSNERVSFTRKMLLRFDNEHPRFAAGPDMSVSFGRMFFINQINDAFAFRSLVDVKK